ncbi:MAG: type II toxin-antitoxin system PemK/MazF family toxin [Acidimicrobiia bacterium]|nr:type II toxin-antitoxin system PemK/MazF family toxin [Acidimicrobiia bacterium]
MVARNDVYWADLGPPGGRRPVCILTRTAVIAARHSVTCAPITRRIRGIASEVEVGREEGLPHAGVINCDNILTVSKDALGPRPVGRLSLAKRAELDRALRFALDIAY